MIASPKAFAPPEQVLGDGRLNLVGLSREELAAEMEALGEKPYRAKQLWHWIYYRGVTDFEAMTNLAKRSREAFAERFVIARPEVSRVETSVDGTRKWLLKMVDGHEIECVHIPKTSLGRVRNIRP